MSAVEAVNFLRHDDTPLLREPIKIDSALDLKERQVYPHLTG